MLIISHIFRIVLQSVYAIRQRLSQHTDKIIASSVPAKGAYMNMIGMTRHARYYLHFD